MPRHDLRAVTAAAATVLIVTGCSAGPVSPNAPNAPDTPFAALAADGPPAAVLAATARFLAEAHRDLPRLGGSELGAVGMGLCRIPNAGAAREATLVTLGLAATAPDEIVRLTTDARAAYGTGRC